jgi:hypothetical protein
MEVDAMSDMITPTTVAAAIPASSAERYCKVAGGHEDGGVFVLKLSEELTRTLLGELQQVVAHWDGPKHRPGIAGS